MVNPNLRRVARRTYTVDEFVEISRSDITCLSQAVTLVGSNRPDHQAIAADHRALPPLRWEVNAYRYHRGTRCGEEYLDHDTFGMHLVKQGRRLAVLAIDPSSEALWW